jgi:hypothetical protein
MEEMIERLQAGIKISETNGDPLTEYSWMNMCGVLISRKDAIRILDILKAIQ